MSDTANEKFLFLDPALAEGTIGELPEEVDPADTLSAVVDALLNGDYDPVVQLASYFVGNDPTFLPDDTEARTLAHPVGRDKLLEALLQFYMEHRRHD